MSEVNYEIRLDNFIERHDEFGEWIHLKGEGAFNYSLEFLNVRIVLQGTADDPFANSFELLCMSGQCGALIITDTFAALPHLSRIEELAREFKFGKLIMTDNEPLAPAVNYGFKLTDEFLNPRTGSTIYQYEYKL